MSQIVNEIKDTFDFLFRIVGTLVFKIKNNDLLSLMFVTFFALSAISIILYFLLDFSEQNSELLQYNTRAQIAENKRMQREMEREQKYNARREQNRIESEERYKKRKAENKKEREEEWQRRHPNVNSNGQEYADAYFKEHKKAVAFNYDGVTFYNNSYLNSLIGKNHQSYDINKAIEQAENGEIVYKKNKKHNTDDN